MEGESLMAICSLRSVACTPASLHTYAYRVKSSSPYFRAPGAVSSRYDQQLAEAFQFEIPPSAMTEEVTQAAGHVSKRDRPPIP